jgi:hypothetical protein
VSEDFTDFLLDSGRNEDANSGETRSLMADMLEFGPVPTTPLHVSPPPAPQDLFRDLPREREKNTVQNLGTGYHPHIPAHLSSIIPSLITLVGRILQELEANLPRLLSLNPSRREIIAQYLDKLASIPQAAATMQKDPSGGLRRWVEGPRNGSQNAALKAYFEELAIIVLGQALLLKTWSDRGVRNWSESDLGRLNWALSTALKAHVPLDREGWQITRPNLYSWYNPTPILQHEIWVSLESWRVTDEGPSFLMTLLGPVRRAQPEIFEPAGYDLRFFKSLWDHIGLFGFDASPDTGVLKRHKLIFSPTLRDGAIVRTGPASVTWIGLESSPFQLMLAELMQIWWGPAAPPFWTIGTGLEVHTRDQLALALGSPKPSILSRIADMEACDAAFVFEEQTIRAQGRSSNANRFREQMEGLQYFKRLRSAGTSLGDLQASVALTKLRPGGILLWAREDALSAKDGPEILHFLLDRAKLVCEWDFSELEHSLPVASPLYPKHFYLFQKETNLEVRSSHRPVRHLIQGQLRSHVELSLLLEDAFQSVQGTSQPRGHWAIHSHSSPTPQRDWVEKWPDPTSQSMVRSLDELRTASLPLANFTTIRLTPDGDPSRDGKWSVHLSLRGFWLSAEHDANGRKLVARQLPRPGDEAQGTGFLIHVSDEAWVAPLSAYLASDLVKKWLDHHAERRGERWILNEQVVKWLPVPKSLLRVLAVPSALEDAGESSFATPLAGEWERLAAEVAYQPRAIREALAKLNQEGQYSDETRHKIQATLFVRTARALEHLQLGQARLLSLVTVDGRVRWRELLEVLPKGECVAISLHPRIRLSGSLPPHLPIGKIDRVKAPSPGILFATESGFSLHIGTDSTVLLNMVWEQLEGLSHPTWNELLQYLKLPRKIELAESTALDVLRSHGEQSARLKDLHDLLGACQLF